MQELNVYGLWGGGQTAKSVAAASLPHRLVQVAGDFGLVRTDNGENFSDLDANFGNQTDWVDSLIGQGTPGIQGTPQELAWLLWVFHGGETTSAVTGPPAKTKHTTVPLPGLGKWASFHKRLGVNQIERSLYQDCQISQIQIEGSTGAKALRVTPTIMSLDPAIVQAADPAQAMPSERTFLYTDGTGRFVIDGVTFVGQSQFTFVANKDYQPVYGDDSVVYDFATGQPAVTIGVTIRVDQAGRDEFNKLAYGSAAPAAGTKPLRNLPALGSYGFDLRAKDNAGAVNGDKAVLTMAGVRWAVPDAPGPNPDGGVPEIALAGAMRKVTGQPAYQFDIDCAAAAFTI
jgi:hypothetical protein